MDFWDVFWLLLLFIPLLILWSCAFVDLFRRNDIPGIAKAGWLLLCLLFPWVGVVIYLSFRPNAPDELIHPHTTYPAQ